MWFWCWMCCRVTWYFTFFIFNCHSRLSPGYFSQRARNQPGGWRDNFAWNFVPHCRRKTKNRIAPAIKIDDFNMSDGEGESLNILFSGGAIYRRRRCVWCDHELCDWLLMINDFMYTSYQGRSHRNWRVCVSSQKELSFAPWVDRRTCQKHCWACMWS